MGRAKRICYLSPMRAAKVQVSLRIRAVSPEHPLLAHTSSESRGTFRRKARSLAPLNGWACAVKICHDGMLEDTNLLESAHINKVLKGFNKALRQVDYTKNPISSASSIILTHLFIASFIKKKDARPTLFAVSTRSNRNKINKTPLKDKIVGLIYFAISEESTKHK